MDVVSALPEDRLDAELHRPRVDILVPVWGRRYIEACLTSAVPSLLSPNNLPVLAHSCDVHMVFLTRQEDEEIIRQHAIMPVLSQYVRFDFVPIDDLIVETVYGVVLTFALTRGMLRHGGEMTKIHFILMLSDFLLADGGLAALAEQILAGRSAIFAPSWRVNDEYVAPQIDDWRDDRGAITISPRALAGVATRGLHPTVVGGMVETGVLSVAHNNQFYWRIDDETLLSHQLLMHLFCIRPERPIGKVDYYIDYGLFESCCPSGDHVVLGDSDRFMAMERQRMYAERDRLRWGATDLAAIAADVGSWTTPVHRMLGKYPCLLHGADLPPQTLRETERAQAFMSKLYARLPAPLSASQHHYWRGGVRAWERRRQGNLRRDLRTVVRRILFGEVPKVTLLHPRWAEFHVIGSVLQSAKQLHANAAVSSNEPEIFSTLLQQSVRPIPFDLIIADPIALDLAGSLVILDVEFDQIAELGFALERLRTVGKPAEIIVILRPRHFFDLGFADPTLQMELARTITESGIESRETRLAGSTFSLVPRSIARAVVALLDSGSRVKFFYALCLAPVALSLSFCCNIYDRRSIAKTRPLGTATTSVFRLVLDVT